MANNLENFNLPLHADALVPMTFLKNPGNQLGNGSILAGDVGGTKINLAIFNTDNGRLLVKKQTSLSTHEKDSVIEVLQDFLESDSLQVDSICLGVAGPIDDGKVTGTNFPWKIDTAKIKKALNVACVTLINDMEANAYGLAVLAENDFITLKEGSGKRGNAAIVSPGTGLGEAGLFWDGVHYHPYASEGGHCDFSPREDQDVALMRFLAKKYGHVSWERLICGQGIRDIHSFLAQAKKVDIPEWLQIKFKEGDPAKAITDAALDKTDANCIAAVELFLKYLATECAQMALKTIAHGGIFIGGGILPKIIEGVDKKTFHKNFCSFGRMQPLLETIPVRVVLNDKTALMGAAFYGAMQLQQA